MEWLLQHLTSLSPESVYLFIAGVLLLCGLGLPIPEDISLISGGYMAHLGVVDVHRMFLICFASVLGGDTIAFFLGRWFGTRLLASRLGERILTKRKHLRVRAYFRKFGSKVIFIGRFLPGLRFSTFFCAGTLHVRFAIFFIYDTLAAVVSVPVLVYLAWAFGDQIDRVVSWARRSEYGILVLALVAAGVVAFKIVRGRRKRRGGSPDAAAAKPRSERALDAP
jgi:membrane protein DedA with SNARE-associated domain